MEYYIKTKIITTIIIVFIFKKVFIYLRKRDKESMSGERRRGSGRKILNQTPAEHGVRSRAQSKDRDIVTRAEINSQTLNGLRHPGAPILFTIERTDTGYQEQC